MRGGRPSGVRGERVQSGASEEVWRAVMLCFLPAIHALLRTLTIFDGFGLQRFRVVGVLSLLL